MKRLVSLVDFFRIRSGLVTTLIAGVACGPTINDDPPELPSEEGRRYASAMCKALETCGCAQWHDSSDACETEYRSRFDRLLESGFRVDPECFEAWIDDAATDPCNEQHDASGELDSCRPLRGRKGKGASCEAYLELVPLGVDECNDGLVCRNAQCVDAPPTDGTPLVELAENEPCGPTYDGVCRGAVDLYCDLRDGVCRRTVPNGAECLDSSSCASCTATADERAYCSRPGPGERGVCDRVPGLGEPCDPMDALACGGCGDTALCDHATETCVEGRVSLLCAQVYSAAPTR